MYRSNWLLAASLQSRNNRALAFQELFLTRSTRFTLFVACLIAIGTLAVHSRVAADESPLYGYSAESSRAERQWEEKFRAIPSPDNMREYMRRLSARPHHVGSPYDKDNADWLAAKFKEFGFDVQIESYDVLFPTPKERQLELLDCKPPTAP
jgi:hypothetical protein